MELAVIKSGGKQYVVTPGSTLEVEKLAVPEGEAVLFDEVLLVAGKAGVKVGQPLVAGAKVEAKLEKTGRRPKLTVIKFKAKTRYRVKRGHRQPFSRVRIDAIKA